MKEVEVEILEPKCCRLWAVMVLLRSSETTSENWKCKHASCNLTTQHPIDPPRPTTLHAALEHGIPSTTVSAVLHFASGQGGGKAKRTNSSPPAPSTHLSTIPILLDCAALLSVSIPASVIWQLIIFDGLLALGACSGQSSQQTITQRGFPR